MGTTPTDANTTNGYEPAAVERTDVIVRGVKETVVAVPSLLSAPTVIDDPSEKFSVPPVI